MMENDANYTRRMNEYYNNVNAANGSTNRCNPTPYEAPSCEAPPYYVAVGSGVGAGDNNPVAPYPAQWAAADPTQNSSLNHTREWRLEREASKASLQVQVNAELHAGRRMPYGENMMSAERGGRERGRERGSRRSSEPENLSGRIERTRDASRSEGPSGRVDRNRDERGEEKRYGKEKGVGRVLDEKGREGVEHVRYVPDTEGKSSRLSSESLSSGASAALLQAFDKRGWTPAPLREGLLERSVLWLFSGLMLACAGIVISQAFSSSLQNLKRPRNYQGLACGWDRSVANLPFAYFPLDPLNGAEEKLLPSRVMCVAQCPSAEQVLNRGFLNIPFASIIKDTQRPDTGAAIRNLSPSSTFISLLHSVKSPLYATLSTPSNFCFPLAPSLQLQFYAAVAKSPMQTKNLKAVASILLDSFGLLVTLMIAAILFAPVLAHATHTAPRQTALTVFSATAATLLALFVRSLKFASWRSVISRQPNGFNPPSLTQPVFSLSGFVLPLTTLISLVALSLFVASHRRQIGHAKKVLDATRDLHGSNFPAVIRHSAHLLQLIAVGAVTVFTVTFALSQSKTITLASPVDASINPNGGIRIIGLLRAPAPASNVTQAATLLMAVFWILEALLSLSKFIAAYATLYFYQSPLFALHGGSTRLPPTYLVDKRTVSFALAGGLRHLTGGLLLLSLIRAITRVVRIIFAPSISRRYDPGSLSSFYLGAEATHDQALADSQAKTVVHSVCDLVHNGPLIDLATSLRPKPMRDPGRQEILTSDSDYRSDYRPHYPSERGLGHSEGSSMSASTASHSRARLRRFVEAENAAKSRVQTVAASMLRSGHRLNNVKAHRAAALHFGSPSVLLWINCACVFLFSFAVLCWAHLNVAHQTDRPPLLYGADPMGAGIKGGGGKGDGKEGALAIVAATALVTSENLQLWTQHGLHGAEKIVASFLGAAFVTFISALSLVAYEVAVDTLLYSFMIQTESREHTSVSMSAGAEAIAEASAEASIWAKSGQFAERGKGDKTSLERMRSRALWQYFGLRFPFNFRRGSLPAMPGDLQEVGKAQRNVANLCPPLLQDLLRESEATLSERRENLIDEGNRREIEAARNAADYIQYAQSRG